MANTQDLKHATWLEPSNVSFIAIPIALMLMTYNEATDFHSFMKQKEQINY